MSQLVDGSGVATWSLLDLVEALACAVYGPVGDDADLSRMLIGDGETGALTIDSRSVTPGSVFVALAGTNDHGMRHAADAFGRGAVAILAGTDLEIDDDAWEAMLAEAAEHGPVLVASDCDGVTALGRAARAWRRRHQWRVIGVTGSSGKTGTKDLLRMFLQRAGARVVASHANWNNEIGVPLTLLDAGASTDVVVCEMGMRGLGQIDWLCDIADPDIGIITNVGTAHLELLGSKAAIAQAKAEVLAGTWAGGVGIFPGMQAQVVEAATRVPDRLLPFGVGDAEEDASAVHVSRVERTSDGIEGTIDLMGVERAFAVPLHGLHHARNVAASAAALVSVIGSASLLADDALQLPVDDSSTAFTAGRGGRHALCEGGVLIDDSYNANPESKVASLDELAAVGNVSTRTAVLGRMAELGPTSDELHAHVGAHVALLGTIDSLVAIGTDSDVEALASSFEARRGTDSLVRFDDVASAIAQLDRWLDASGATLVKASNSSGLSRLAAAIVERHGMQASTPPAAQDDRP